MINYDQAQVHDVEVFPNAFTLTASPMHYEGESVWEISDYRDDRLQLFAWFEWLHQNHIPMVGFNNEGYDYVICHFLYMNRDATPAQIYAKSQEVIGSRDRFAHVIWARDRFAPQIDLYKIHHFDNVAKITSLKSLQIAMRRESVRESRLPFDLPVAAHHVDGEVIPYNRSDVDSTKQFAHCSAGAIDFRLGLIDQFGLDCLCWNDTKIGERMLEQRLGDRVCYDWSSGRKQKRQTVRHQIRLRDIIFPYIQFQNPEFQRVHQFMLEQVLTSDDASGPDTKIKTKGVFTTLSASVGGLEFDFGTGGVHASVEAQRFEADDTWMIRDIDVASLYPSIAIVNGLAPEHLGQAFIAEYAKIPAERKQHAKGTYMNAALKLAANGAWGKSNSKFSVFYDPQYAMTIPINGQLLICMLAEQLLAVPSIRLIQANTDGITFMIRRDELQLAKQIEQRWEDYTKLVLEDAEYSRMWIRDVNNYVAEDVSGKLKQKGAYWHPDPLNYAESISLASPPSWHKDLGNIASIRAAVAAMVYGVDPEIWLRSHTDPFDFMIRAKVDRSSKLMLGDQQIQSTSRYFVTHDGQPLMKISPPVAGGVVGQYKRANGVTKAEYDRVMHETKGEWDERVCTKNRSKYTTRQMAFQAGWLVTECNDASSFDFTRLNYDFYVQEAKKLIIS